MSLSLAIEWDSDGWSSWAHRSKPLVDKTLHRILDGHRRYGKRFLISYFGSGGACSILKPLGALTTHDRYAIVNDDKFRFLNVNEQRKAMGFPENYILPAQHSVATYMLGNAVCPLVMRLIIQALLTQV